MIDKYPVVTLIGSTKFKDEFAAAEKTYTMLGNIVLSRGVFHHADNVKLTSSLSATLADMHKRKIDLADMVYVVNPNDYIGELTKSEIEYARRHGKPVFYIYEHREGGHDA